MCEGSPDQARTSGGNGRDYREPPSSSSLLPRSDDRERLEDREDSDRERSPDEDRARDLDRVRSRDRTSRGRTLSLEVRDRSRCGRSRTVRSSREVRVRASRSRSTRGRAVRPTRPSLFGCVRRPIVDGRRDERSRVERSTAVRSESVTVDERPIRPPDVSRVAEARVCGARSVLMRRPSDVVPRPTASLRGRRVRSVPVSFVV